MSLLAQGTENAQIWAHHGHIADMPVAAQSGGSVLVVAALSALGGGELVAFTTVGAGWFALRVFRCAVRQAASSFPGTGVARAT